MSISNSSYGKDKIKELLKGGGRLHFVGASGAGMAPLAELCLMRGVSVSGSDIHPGEAYRRLTERGARLYPVHNADAVGDAAALVYSLAVPEDNEEIASARKRGIPLISRAELLGAISGEYSHSIGISGTHGKSTTVAMTSEIFSLAGRHPTVVSGATLSSGEPLLFGEGDCFIYEACEYRDSFLLTEPSVSVILNVELDHPDYFRSEDALEKSFLAFALSARDFALVNVDGASGRRIFSELHGEKFSFGRTAFSDFRYRVEHSGVGRVDFSLYFKCCSLGNFTLNTIGGHFCEDAAAAVATAYLMGISPQTAREALLKYTGIARRLEPLGKVAGRSVFYDYAHHPTEISAVISAIKENFGKCTVIFRPHTYSRTEALWADFVRTLKEADFVVLTDVFAARETEIEGVNSTALARAIGRRATRLEPSQVGDYLLSSTEGAIVLMGAGDVEDIKCELLKRKD